MTEFEPVGAEEFRYEAFANNIDYDIDSPRAEATRMSWLRQYLDDNGLCAEGFEITDRSVVVLERHVLGDSYNIIYEGHCTGA